jgi:hypothetical protein
MRKKHVVEIGMLVVGLTVACVIVVPRPAAGAGAAEPGGGRLQAPVLLSVEIVPDPAPGAAGPNVDCDGPGAERCAATPHGAKARAEPKTLPPASDPIRPVVTR